MSEMIKRLSERFPTKAHAERKQGGRTLTYLGIEHVIGRLNEIFGASYSTEIIESKIQGDWAIVTVRITYVDDQGNIRWKDGIGADLWTYVDRDGRTQADMDKALKTAYAEGIKKAGHQLGVGLYLWDDDVRKEVESEMRQQTQGGSSNGNGQSSENRQTNGATSNGTGGPKAASPKQISKVGAEMARVGWTDKDGRDYLLKTFNKLSRAELTSLEISKMIDHLVALPSKE